MDNKTFYDMMKSGMSMKEIMDAVESANKRVIEEQKQEQKQVADKGKRIADLATRLLHDDLTDEDFAYIHASYMRKLAPDLPAAYIDIMCDAELLDKSMKDNVAMLSSLAHLADMFGVDLNDKEALSKAAKNVKNKSNDEDDCVIDKFLRDLGI